MVTFDSLPPSDDDESSSNASADPKARRRRLHTEAEQRRRDSIKKGFDNLLLSIQPVNKDENCSFTRMSKDTILNRSIGLIFKYSKQHESKRLEIDNLLKEVEALRILNSNYERMAHETTSSEFTEDAVSELSRLQVFQLFMETLFDSFDKSVSESEFPEFSDRIITWLEENCKPENLRSIMDRILIKMTSENLIFSSTNNDNDNHLRSNLQCQPICSELQSATNKRILPAISTPVSSSCSNLLYEETSADLKHSSHQSMQRNDNFDFSCIKNMSSQPFIQADHNLHESSSQYMFKTHLDPCNFHSFGSLTNLHQSISYTEPSLYQHSLSSDMNNPIPLAPRFSFLPMNTTQLVSKPYLHHLVRNEHVSTHKDNQIDNGPVLLQPLNILQTANLKSATDKSFINIKDQYYPIE